MNQDWSEALRFAALPGAVRVRFEYETLIEDGTPTRQMRLTSYSQTGIPIGDDRDYDLLKAAISPLEALAERCAQEKLIVALDLKTGHLARDS